MELSEIMRELQNHQGRWIGVKNKKIILSETRMGLENKISGSAQPYQIPRMYSGYPAWRTEVEEKLKEMVNMDALRQHEPPPFEETESEVMMPLETEPVKEERPRKSFLERILGI